MKDITLLILNRLRHDIDKNFVTPQDLTDDERQSYEIDFFSSESFLLGVKLGMEIGKS